MQVTEKTCAASVQHGGNGLAGPTGSTGRDGGYSFDADGYVPLEGGRGGPGSPGGGGGGGGGMFFVFKI